MIGDVIRKYRMQHHLSQAQMAKKLAVSPSYVSSLERGVRNSSGRPYVVSHQVLKRISTVTGISISSLEKEAGPQKEQDFLIDPLTDEEVALIVEFRRADPETKGMIRRIMQYAKVEEKLKLQKQKSKERK